MLFRSDYPWPGNVRELQNALQFAIVHSNDKIIYPRDLPAELREHPAVGGRQRSAGRRLRPEAVRAALEKCGGNKAKAARDLGIGRATLYRYMDEHPELKT